MRSRGRTPTSSPSRFTSYRARWDEAEPDPGSAALEEKIKATKTLDVPTVYVQSAVEGVNPPEESKDVPSKFSGPFALKQLEGVGHFPTREAPEAVAEILIAHFCPP